MLFIFLLTTFTLNNKIFKSQKLQLVICETAEKTENNTAETPWNGDKVECIEKFNTSKTSKIRFTKSLTLSYVTILISFLIFGSIADRFFNILF
uniref:Uncharacterized protein n=1 Tax=Romanomermis culicivorax TaxID=13658 RepID=A0A915HES6_ROMCU